METTAQNLPPASTQQPQESAAISQEADVKKEETESKPRKRFPATLYVLLCFILLLLIIGGVTGYLYWDKQKDYNSLVTEKENLEEEYDVAVDEKEQLTLEKTQLETDNSEQSAEISYYEEQQAKVKAYNDFLDYTYYLIALHNGYYGITEEEFQAGRAKAEVAGDQDFLAAVDASWNDKHISQAVRFMNLMNFWTDKVSTYLVPYSPPQVEGEDTQ